MIDFPEDIEKHRGTFIIFLIVSFFIGIISDLSYLYPGIHILKFVGFVIAMALLVNVTIVQTFIIVIMIIMIDYANFMTRTMINLVLEKY